MAVLLNIEDVFRFFKKKIPFYFFFENNSTFAY